MIQTKKAHLHEPFCHRSEITIPRDLRGYRLFAHISAALGCFMFAKRANRGTMRKS